jgi:IS605 OrfB family transposase
MRLKARESDRRKDWIERTTTELVHDYDLIAVEDLTGINVAQKRGLNRSIHAQAWSMFRRRLEDKASAASPGACQARSILAAGLAVTARGGTSHQGPDETRTQPVAA